MDKGGIYYNKETNIIMELSNDNNIKYVNILNSVDIARTDACQIMCQFEIACLLQRFTGEDRSEIVLPVEMILEEFRCK